MPVPVVRVGQVRVVVDQRRVEVRVRVRLDPGPSCGCAWWRVVDVGVVVLQRLVRVPVAVAGPEQDDRPGGHGPAATSSAAPSRSPRMGTAASAPTNGAVAK